METYKVKPIKSEQGYDQPASSESPKYPNISIPVDKDWFSNIKPGEDCTITLKGKVTEISLNEPEKAWKRNEVRLEVHEVSYNKTAKDVEEMLEDD